MTDTCQYNFSGGAYGDDYNPTAPCGQPPGPLPSSTPAPSPAPMNAPTPDVEEPEHGELGCAVDLTTGVRVRDSDTEPETDDWSQPQRKYSLHAKRQGKQLTQHSRDYREGRTGMEAIRKSIPFEGVQWSQNQRRNQAGCMSSLRSCSSLWVPAWHGTGIASLSRLEITLETPIGNASSVVSASIPQ